MIFNPQNLVYVYFNSKQDKRLVGRLFLKERKILFEYDREFLQSGLELSPFKLPLKSGVINSRDHIFDGLFGVFNDSLPDGWGRLLLDRKLTHAGIVPGSLSPLDRLCFVGSHGMGALSYEPENLSNQMILHQDLDQIEYEIQSFQDEQTDQYIDELLALGGSSAGARPKIVVKRDNEDWLIKFRSRLDPEDTGCMEYSYHAMAKAAGLDVPEAKLFLSTRGPGFFGVKRFDRKDNERIHMHSIAGLLHADHRAPCLDYQDIIKTTLFLTGDIREGEKMFQLAVFNSLSHNRDDHSKNFSYLMDEQGAWRVSPPYDLTFSSGPGGEQSTMVMGEGKNPGPDHLIRLGRVAQLNPKKIKEIIDQTKHALSQWKQLATEHGVRA